MTNINLTYHSNYNGWDIEVDGKEHEDFKIEELLCEITLKECDEDGYYCYNDRLTTNNTTEILKVIDQHFGDVKVSISIDKYSS